MHSELGELRRRHDDTRRMQEEYRQRMLDCKARADALGRQWGEKWQANEVKNGHARANRRRLRQAAQAPA